MNINKVQIQNLLNTGTNQYVVPFFQRPYVWKKEDCENLLEDIYDTRDLNQQNVNREHFIGTIITKNSKESSQIAGRYNLVDGQQRMTTFSLLLKALANSVDLNEPKANYLFENINSTLSFRDSYGETLFRIEHNRIDREYFEKVMSSDQQAKFKETAGQSKIIDAYRFFLEEFKKHDNEQIRALNQTILTKFVAINMVLDENDDEQEIFDTINSLGVKLTTSELLKNFVFSNPEIQKHYVPLWENVFEPEEEIIKFWNTKKTAGRLYRENIDVLLYCYLLNQLETEVSLEHLFKNYKEWLKGKSTAEKKKFLENLKEYAEIYSELPSGPELNNLTFDDSEKRFFHIIENLNITTIYPLVLFLFKEIGDASERLKCLSLLESYLVRRTICRITTKNYNNLFVSIVKSIKSSKAPSVYDALRETLASHTEATNKFPTDEEVRNGFANSVLSNQHAREILFNIGLYQIRTVLNDMTSLSSHSFSTEHILPKKWSENWRIADSSETAKQNRNHKLLTLGNLTIITKNLNSKIRNSSWKNKKTILQQYSALPLTTNYTSLPDWNEQCIQNRANDLEKIALTIWKNIN